MKIDWDKVWRRYFKYAHVGRQEHYEKYIKKIQSLVENQLKPKRKRK